jgi:hypothetical protein
MVRLGGLVRAAGSARTLVALVVPLLPVAALATWGRLAWGDLARARSVLLWLALVVVALLAKAMAAALDRRRVAALVALAGASLVAQAGLSAALTLDVRLSAGEGEESPPVEATYLGRAARPPPVTVLSLPAERGGEAVLSIDGRERPIPVGRETRVGWGTWVTVENVFAAPTFVVRRREEGKDEDVFQVKLRPANPDYFEVGVLPYRFYVTMPPPPAGALGPTPPTIHLLVQRGKLKILDREFARAEPARFEGIELGYGDGARWAVVRVRSRPWPWLAGAAAILGGVAAATALLRRRGVRGGS